MPMYPGQWGDYGTPADKLAAALEELKREHADWQQGEQDIVQNPEVARRGLAVYRESYFKWEAEATEQNQDALKDRGADEIPAAVQHHLHTGGVGGAPLFKMCAVQVVDDEGIPIDVEVQARAVDQLYDFVNKYQNGLVRELEDSGERDPKKLAEPIVIDRYGGEDATKATHSSINLSNSKGAKAFQCFKDSGLWAVAVLMCIMRAIAASCKMVRRSDEEPKNWTWMYYGSDGAVGVRNAGMMDLHADGGYALYDERYCYRLAINGETTTMMWAFCGFEAERYRYLMTIPSGHMIGGGNDLFRYNFTRLKHGVPKVGSPRFTIIIDF